MPTTTEPLALARRHHDAGNLGRAEELYRQILAGGDADAQVWYLHATVCYALGRPDWATDSLRQALRLRPGFAEAHKQLGLALAQQGRPDEAVACFQRAAALCPDDAETHANVATLLRRLGKGAEALPRLQQALRLKPDFADAHLTLGNVYRDQQRWEEALACYTEAARLRPDYPEAHNNRGAALVGMERFEEALACYDEALRLRSNYAEAHDNRGQVLGRLGRHAEAIASYSRALDLRPEFADTRNSLGVALLEAGRHAEALAVFEEALRRRPDDAAAHDNRGTALVKLNRAAEAVAGFREAARLRPDRPEILNHLAAALNRERHYEEAVGVCRTVLQLVPDSAEGHANLGTALGRLDRTEEALSRFTEALRLKPESAIVHNNRGAMLTDLGRPEEALRSFEEAIRLAPDYADARWNRSLILLLRGNFAEGWAEYEWRWRRQEPKPRPFPQPVWEGEALAGRTILLHAEQGLGDALQFIRYAPLVKQRGGTVVVECRAALTALLAFCTGVDHVVARGRPLPAFNIHAPLLSLPRIFGTTLQSIPADVPYLQAAPLAVERWRQELAAEGFKVGICWQGNPGHPGDRHRSVALARFAELAAVPGVRLFSLQKGTGSEQLAGATFPVTALGERLHDFADTAALVRALDLVITVDTAVAHLAGALGVPVWVALPFAPDWRWLLEREDSPWYPTLRLFRQQRHRDWDSVFSRLADALRLSAACGSARGAPPQAGGQDLQAEARRCHRAGALAQAVPLYRQALAADASDAQAWYLLGAACQGLGQVDEAVAALRRAVALEPGHPEAHNLLGMALARAGRFEEAVAGFRRALELRPGNAEADRNLSMVLRQQGQARAAALCNDGVRLLGQGKVADAVARFREAVRARPDFPEGHSNLGLALAAQGRHDDAVASHEQALRLRPDFAEAHYNLGVALMEQRRPAAAAVAFREAVRLKPTIAEAHNNLGLALAALDRRSEAVVCYRECLRLRPEFAPAHCSLGVALGRLGCHDEAMACFREALRLQPDFVEAHVGLGNVFRERDQPEQALACYHTALRLRHDFVEARNNVGTVLRDRGQPDEAVANYKDALVLQPDFAEAHNNLGTAYMDLGRVEDAGASYREALRLQPNYADAHFNYALLLLLQGRYAEGWAEYEWRWQRKEFGTRTFGQPRWDGSPPAGRTILLHAEQGLGDTLQFVRYAALVKQRGGTIVLECQAPLCRLLANCPGVDCVVARGEPLPAFDAHLPLLSLPQVFGTRLETMPAEVPYLHADPALVEPWRRELGPDGFKVGIVWQGSTSHRGDRQRSVALTRFAALAAVPGVRLFSLQKGTGSEQLADAPFPVTALGERLHDFADTAALVQALDLVITVDTAVAHLAGALAVPVWVTLPFAPDWRWLLEREDSPWYPTMRLFRQQRRGDWDAVFNRLADALRVAAASGLANRATPVAAQSTAAADNRLGIALQSQGKLEEAAAAFRRAIRARPDYGLAHTNLGNILKEQGRLDEALICYREAVRLQPEHPDALCNLGLALAARDQLDEALACYRECLRVRPEHAPAHSNQGHALYSMGRYAESAANLAQALRLRPDDAEAHYSRGLSLLVMGHFAEGWAEYEWRWRIAEFPGRRFRRPRWDGGALAGRRILLHAEQGLGDTLQFIRYAPLVKQHGGTPGGAPCGTPLGEPPETPTVLVECQQQLAALLATCPGVDRVVVRDAAVAPFDVHIPLMSLPLLLGTTLETIPADVPYLRANTARVEEWRRELGDGVKVGIVWQGSPGHLNDRRRSVALARFAELAAVPEVRLFSLQKGAGSEQLAEASFPVTALGERLADMADTAAVVRALDLVITVDTAVAHLAGALGVPVWVALPFAPDWRWLLEREDSPWYPTMRLFRQQRPDDWDGVFNRLADALRDRVGARPHPIEIEISPGELIDRITLLEIELARSGTAAVRADLAALQAAGARFARGAELTQLTADLKAVNEALRGMDDEIRQCACGAEDESRFTELARSVYDHNERRAALKRAIDRLLVQDLGGA